MSSCIYKYGKESSEAAAFRWNSLFRIFLLSHSLVISSCYNYIIQGIFLYRIFTSNSGRYEVYILANYINYNILKVIEKQLMNFAV